MKTKTSRSKNLTKKPPKEEFSGNTFDIKASANNWNEKKGLAWLEETEI